MSETLFACGSVDEGHGVQFSPGGLCQRNDGAGCAAHEKVPNHGRAWPLPQTNIYNVNSPLLAM